MPFLAYEITVSIKSDFNVYSKKAAPTIPVICAFVAGRTHSATGESFSKCSLKTGIITALSFRRLDVVGRLLKL